MAVNPLVSLTTSCARPSPISEVLGFLLASHERSKMCRSRRLHTRLSMREWDGLKEWLQQLNFPC